MANRYETVFILTPVLSEEQAKEAVKTYADYLNGKKVDIKHQEHWGLRKLAYPIQKKTTGFYHLFEFEADGEVIAELELQMKRDERVIRFLTTKMDKHAIAWAEKKRARKSAKKETETADA